MRALGGSIGPGHPLRSHMDVIESKIPTELLDRIRRQAPPDSPHADVPSEKALVRLHKQVNRNTHLMWLKECTVGSPELWKQMNFDMESSEYSYHNILQPMCLMLHSPWELLPRDVAMAEEAPGCTI